MKYVIKDLSMGMFSKFMPGDSFSRSYTYPVKFSAEELQGIQDMNTCIKNPALRNTLISDFNWDCRNSQDEVFFGDKDVIYVIDPQAPIYNLKDLSKLPPEIARKLVIETWICYHRKPEDLDESSFFIK